MEKQVKYTVACFGFVLLSTGVSFATGAYFVVCKNNGIFKPADLLDGYIAIYFIAAAASAVACLIGLALALRKKKSFKSATFSYYMVFAIFCLQAGMAAFSATYITVIDLALKRVTYTLPKYIYTWADLIRAQAVVSFVVAVPCLCALMQFQWSEWAELLKNEPEDIKDLRNENVRSALT